MTTDPAPPAYSPPPAPHRGKKVASAVISSVALLFGLVFTPIAIVAVVNARPLGSEWSTGSNMINVVFMWIFGFALVMLAVLAAAGIFFAWAAKSVGLSIYAAIVTAFVFLGAVAMLAAAAITVSG